MPMLLSKTTSFFGRRKSFPFTDSHHTANQRVDFSPSFNQSLFSLLLIIGLFITLFHNLYDALGRRIQTTFKGSKVSYYYDPEVEYMELGHSLNGNRTWNLFGPDRSGT
jgi:hypothetical protein